MTHPDDVACQRFANAMMAKLREKRAEGYGGWQDKSLCSAELLSSLLRDHVEKGDPVDVANFAMMLHQRGERIMAGQHVVEQDQRIARLRQWISDLQADMYVNCVYCGHRYGPGETTPVSMADALKAHIAGCPEHPMSGLIRAGRGAYHALLSYQHGNGSPELAAEIVEAMKKALEAAGSGP